MEILACRASRRVGLGLIVLAICSAAIGAEIPLDPKDAKLPKLEFPSEFALVFSFGYVNDWMPKEPAKFEEMLRNMKRTGINTVHCKYTDQRRKSCEANEIMMLIDLAVPEHDLKQARCEPGDAEDLANLDGAEDRFAAVKKELDQVVARLKEINQSLKPPPGSPQPEPNNRAALDRAALEKEKQSLESRQTELTRRKSILIASNVKYICKQSRGSRGVWGYGLYYDNGTNGSFLNHAVEKLRTWDATHVTFVGSYRHSGLETVTLNPGCYGWYDFPWQRGILWHYLDMMVVHDLCRRRGAILANYPQYSGLKQDLMVLNQTIAAGGKMSIWFIGGPMSRDTYEWHDKNELVEIAAEIRPLYKELMKIGHPTAFYSTPVTKTHDDKPVSPPAVPRWFKPIPKDSWVHVTSGEAVIGMFQYADTDKTDAIFVANHNAFASQSMELQLQREQPFKVMLFDRAKGDWRELQSTGGTVKFELGPGRGELLKIAKP